MARVGRLSLMVAATACSSIGAACGGRSPLELSFDEDAASADVSVPTLEQDGAMDSAETADICVPTLGQDGAIDGAETADVSAPTETPPSCQAGGPGLTNCGADSESCCTSLEVTGGTYYRTYDTDDRRGRPRPLPDGGPLDEADPAAVSGFRLDKYLVTVGRFRQYVNYVTRIAGATPPNGGGIHTHLNGGLGLVNSGSPGAYETGWDAADWNMYIATGPSAVSTWDANLTSSLCTPYDTWTVTAGSQENLPINCVNWWEAYAFCIWDGGFLPSEAEWAYAAAGGSLQREYPWGSEDPGMSSQYAICECSYPSGSVNCTGVANIAPVGTATDGAGLWGQLDMAGEFAEWNLDWFAPYANPCTDCAYLASSSSRMVRGGDFDDVATELVSPSRFYGKPEGRDSDIGFRCARKP